MDTAKAVTEIRATLDWMHRTKKTGGLGYSVDQVKKTHAWNAYVALDGVSWPNPEPVPPPTRHTTRAVWDNNSGNAIQSEWPTLAAAGFNTFFGAAEWTTWLSQITAAGYGSWATLGHYVGPGFSYSDAQAVAVAQAAIATGGVRSLFIADEPPASAVTAIKNRYLALKTALPTTEVIISYYDAATVGQFAGCIDAIAADIYPGRFGWDETLVAQLAAACVAAGIPFYGTFEAFTDGTSNYPLPNPTQLQGNIDAWMATTQKGWACYAWGATSGNPANNLENHPELLSLVTATPSVQ